MQVRLNPALSALKLPIKRKEKQEQSFGETIQNDCSFQTKSKMILRNVYSFMLGLGLFLGISLKSQAQDSLYVIVGQTPSAPLLSTKKNPVNISENAVLVANGCIGQVVWSDGIIGASRIVALERTTEFRARCITAQRCTSAESKLVVQVTLNSPQIEGIQEICEGKSVTLTARGCVQETRWQDDGVGEKRTFQPTTTTTYQAKCVQNGMVSSTTSILVTVNPKPAPPTITKSNSSTVELGQAVALQANCNGATVLWDNGSVQSVINVIPAQSTNTYSAVCVSTQGCQSEKSSFILTTQSTKPTLTVSNQKVCAGQSVTLIASNCVGSYLWSSGENTPTINPILSNTSQFWVKCKTAAGESEPVTAIIEVTANPTNPILLAQPSSILFGQSTQLTAMGCNGIVKWSNQTTGNSLTIIPNGISTYEAYCETKEGCRSGLASIQVMVYPSSTKLIATPSSICAGETTGLNAIGCKGSVIWFSGQTGDSFQVTPTQTTTYFAICQTGDVKDTSFVDVTVYSLPSEPILKANKMQIQSGELVILTAQGCNSSTVWDTGIIGEKIQIFPQTTAEYGAYCQSEKGCNGKIARIKIQVNAPSLTLTANRPKICQGETTMLTAEGCQNGTLTWDQFTNQRNNTQLIQPSTTTIYKVKCETLAGTSEATTTITVNTKTKLVVTNAELCENGTIDLRRQVSNATTFANLLFRKSTPGTVNIPYIQTLNQSGVYYVFGTNANSCVDTAQLTLTVHPKPAIPSVNMPIDSVMAGSGLTLQGKGCENGTLRWWMNDKSETGNRINFVAEQNAVIKVLCVTAKGCISDTNYLYLPVKQGIPVLAGLPPKTCEGNTVSLEVKGCPQGILVGTTNDFRVVTNVFSLMISLGSDSLYYNGTWVGTKLKRGDSLFAVIPAYCYTRNAATTFKSTPRVIEIPIQAVSLTDLYFYPNPASGKIRIKGRDCVNGLRLKVWDVVGRLLMDGYGTSIDNEIELDVSSLSSGEYLLEIQTATGESNVSRLLKYNK